MQLFLKILSGMANSVEPELSDLGLHCLHLSFFQKLRCSKFYCVCIVMQWGRVFESVFVKYEGESISNQPNLFPVEIHLFFFDVIAL